MMIVDQSVEWLAREPKYSEETCPSATLFTTNPTWFDTARTRSYARTWFLNLHIQYWYSSAVGIAAGQSGRSFGLGRSEICLLSTSSMSSRAHLSRNPVVTKGQHSWFIYYNFTFKYDVPHKRMSILEWIKPLTCVSSGRLTIISINNGFRATS
jgi:hypothetical protein